MGASGSFPLDLVLFGMIAAFLVLRLRSILGRRTGFERPPDSICRCSPARPGGWCRTGRCRTDRSSTAWPSRSPPPRRAARCPNRPRRPARRLVRMRRVAPGFQPSHFLSGAEAAFRIIVVAFAARQPRPICASLLSDDTFRAFEAAITARETAGETQRTEIRAIQAATIEAADLRGSMADITVRFVSDQVNVTLGRDGEPVAGADAVTEITDLWTFERDLDLGRSDLAAGGRAQRLMLRRIRRASARLLAPVGIPGAGRLRCASRRP